MLDAGGRHRWANTATAPPYLPPPDAQQPSLGDFRSITVRQGTSKPPQQGYVGYAWKAFSSGIGDCNARPPSPPGPPGPPGQFDLLANLNTDADNEGANAQNGYVTSGCGLQAGTRLGYSLLTHDAQNFYLDSSSLHIRQVLLDPPAFSSPASGQSFGRLNMNSTRLLLHPAGHVVSISNDNNKIETLKLAHAALGDAEAARKYLARSCSGGGSRPGLIDSPAAAAISPDGVILVLEDGGGNNRIQAFDLGGNPGAVLQAAAHTLFPAARRHPRRRVSGPRSRVHRLPVRAVEGRGQQPPARHIPSGPDRHAADLDDAQRQWRPTRGRLLAQRLHAELRGPAAARRRDTEPDRALGQPVGADPAGGLMAVAHGCHDNLDRTLTV